MISAEPVSLGEVRGASFLQSAFWADFKGEFGWKPFAFRVKFDGGGDGAGRGGEGANVGGAAPPDFTMLVLSRVIAGRFSLAYIPWAPELPALLSDAEKCRLLAETARVIKPFLPRSTIFARFDPPWANAGKDAPPPEIGAPFVFAGASVQPPDTVILDLKKSEDALLSEMKSKWRYNIKLGERKVAVKKTGKADLKIFYDLFRETAERDGIALHSLEYYEKLFDRAEKFKKELNLYLAQYEGEFIAAIIVLFFEGRATYLYGASSNARRNVMAPYALQWAAIKDAKAASCTGYDFFGIPPNDDKRHPMAGLYRFKTGFGGEIIHRPASADFPYKKFFYFLFALAEKTRYVLRSLKKRRRRHG